jgi:hypothetical protein
MFHLMRHERIPSDVKHLTTFEIAMQRTHPLLLLT